jgi:voltage-gated potassium channel
VITTFADVSPDVVTILETVDTGICFVFLADFFYKLLSAESKLGYLKWGWIDFVSSIPAIGPLRWGRFARFVRILRLLRGVRSIKHLVSCLVQRREASALSTAVIVSLLVVVFASVAVLDFERDWPNANIRSAEDALWWAICTVTSVGYGDLYPISLEGRLIGAATMACGIAVFGTFTGLAASWFLSPQEAEQDRELEEIRHRLSAIERHLSRMVERAEGTDDAGLAAVQQHVNELSSAARRASERSDTPAKASP